VLLVGSVALVSCGGDDDSDAGETTTTTTSLETTTTGTTTTGTTEPAPEPQGPTVVRVDVVNGAPKGGIVRASVDRGERVALVVSSDVADEIHLHGYDKAKDVAAGGTIRLPFEATIPGRFEAELESRGVQIAEITVEP
jgi:hypothetical protein